MTKVTVKTKAEHSLAQHFDQLATVPAAAIDQQLRRNAFGAFASMGLPSRRSESWRYTDLRTLMPEAFAPLIELPSQAPQSAIGAALGVFRNFEPTTLLIYNGALIGVVGGALEQGVTVRDRAKAAIASSKAWLDDAVVALNAAFAIGGAVIEIAAGCKLTRALHLVHIIDSAEPVALTWRNIVRIGAGAEAKLIETSLAHGGGPAQINAATEVVVGDGAKLRHVKLVKDGSSTQHLGSWLIDLGAAAQYWAFQFTLSPKLARNQALITFRGENTSMNFNAAFLARGSEHVDTTLVIDHAVPHCTSRELVKGVLDNHAKGVFQGKVIVRPNAQKTDGKQLAKALMLSESAEFSSKPELEIYADDVACGHGSTTAQIDDDPLFYLRARGIPEAVARRLLVEAFVLEVFDTVQSEALRGDLERMAYDWLQRH